MSALMHREIRTSDETLGWHELPVVGADRERREARAHAWRIILAGLAAFWAGVACVVAWAVLS